MNKKHILPEEIRMILRKIAIENSGGHEVEGGSIFERNIEEALKKQGIDSSAFGEQYPNISPSLKKLIAICFLYDVACTSLHVNIEMPRYKRGTDGSLQPISTTEHLENLHRLFLLAKGDNDT